MPRHRPLAPQPRRHARTGEQLVAMIRQRLANTGPDRLPSAREHQSGDGWVTDDELAAEHPDDARACREEQQAWLRSLAG